ncbi:acyltransferase [Desulfospira joergensenii]|uniref:acyltransferase n=1 Tax=Desulfospira joergensenii TaxID=53329 RepID=UPI0003B51E55|nr:acyltransferase [Desulfospira joergensenii]
MATTQIGKFIKGVFSIHNLFKNVFMKFYFQNIVGNINNPFSIHHSTIFRNERQISIGSNVFIGKDITLNGRSKNHPYGIVLGESTYLKGNSYIDAYGGMIEFKGSSNLSQFSLIAGQGKVTIGKYVIFGSHCIVLSSNHIFNSLEVPYMFQGDIVAPVVIEDNVWIGAGSIILSGTKIGRNSVIGAGSIVNKTVPPNCLYVNKLGRRIVRELNTGERKNYAQYRNKLFNVR